MLTCDVTATFVRGAIESLTHFMSSESLQNFDVSDVVGVGRLGQCFHHHAQLCLK